MFQIKGPILAAAEVGEGCGEILRQAHALARSYKVDLQICHVLPEIFAVRPLFPHFHLDDALKVAELEASVRGALLERIRMETGEEFSQVIIEQGTWHGGILRAAERIGAGAVVVGETTDEKLLPVSGEAAGLVVRYAPCPVLVARPSPQGNVLAATDFSDRSLPAVEAGAAEARHRQTDLTIIHAVDLFSLVMPWSDEIAPGTFPLDLSNQMMKTWQERLDECVDQFDAKGGGLLHSGPAASTILSAAAELKAQLLVIGTHGRTGLSRLALGSVAEAVVCRAPCSVLVVRMT